MALINITPCENTTAQYLRSTSLTVRLRNVGHDSEVQQTTQRVRSVVPLTHSTSPIYCSCHQPEVCLHSAQSPVTQTVMLRHLRLFGHIVPRTPMRTIHMPSTLASTTRRRSGDDLVVVLVKHGCAPSRTTSNNRIWGPAQSL